MHMLALQVSGMAQLSGIRNHHPEIELGIPHLQEAEGSWLSGLNKAYG